MEQRQIAQLMTIIANNYQSQLNKLDGKTYYDNLSMFLIDQDYTLVANNLKNHIMDSSYLPTVADLVKKPAKEERPNIPGRNETMFIITGANQALLDKPKPSKEELQNIFKGIDEVIKGAKHNAKRRHFNPFE